MTTAPASPFRLDQVGTASVRFPSGEPIPDQSDISVDPYWKTRMPKGVQVEAIQFWPQVKEKFPGIVLLHDWWGLNAQIKDLGARLACEGFNVILPNLYIRQGGMVTASAEVAEALMSRTNALELLQDINTCCEFLNTQESVKRNVHGVIGYGMGGALAIRFGCIRKRLRAAVSFYSQLTTPPDILKNLYCPVLYHRAGAHAGVTDEDLGRLQQSGQEHNKRIDVRTYPEAPPGFCNDTRPDTYRPEAAQTSWSETLAFLRDCFADAR